MVSGAAGKNEREGAEKPACHAHNGGSNVPAQGLPQKDPFPVLELERNTL